MNGSNVTVTPKEMEKSGDVNDNNGSSVQIIVPILVVVLFVLAVGIIIFVLWKLRKNKKRAMNRSDVEVPLTASPKKEPDVISEPDSLIFSEISLHRKDETFYSTKLRFSVEESMKEKGMSVIIGPAGSGKSSIGLAVLSSLMNKKLRGKKCTSKVIERIGDWEDKINPKKTTVLLFDSCFEKWNWMPDTISEDMSSLLRLHQEYIVSRSVLAIFTFRSYTWDKYASRIRENIDIKDDCIFSLLDDDAFSDDERKNILARHFQVNNIVCCDDINKENVASSGILDKTKEGQMHTDTFLGLINISKQIPSTVGFPVVCSTFCFNRRLLGKGKEYFLNPIESLRKEITSLMKSKREEDKQKFCTLVYASLNEGRVKVGEERMTLYSDICKALKLKNGATQVLDIDDHYLMETSSRTFEFQHEILMRIVLFTFAEQYPEIFVKNCNANVLLRYIRTKHCDVDENEDVLTVTKEENYKLLAQRFLEILNDPDIEDIRSHVCMSEKKFSEIFAKRYSKEFEGTGKKKNPSIGKVRSSVRNSINRISWGQQTKL